MKKLAIIIVVYNTKEILRDCLKNLAGYQYPWKEVIVVDNASVDNSADMVAEEFPWVKLIRAENKGLAAGYNLGIKNADNPDYFLFLGSDAFPKPSSLEGVIDYLDTHAELGAATCKLVLRDGSLDMDAHRGFPTPFAAFSHFSGLEKFFPKSKLFSRYFLGWEDFAKPHPIGMCISHFMMVKAEVFTKVGLWDEDYFVYGEDVDMCWRMKKLGYKTYYLPQFTCLHYKGAGVGIRKETQDVTKASSETRRRMKQESVRAMKLFYTKHMHANYPRLVNKLVVCGIALLAKLRD